MATITSDTLNGPPTGRPASRQLGEELRVVLECDGRANASHSRKPRER